MMMNLHDRLGTTSSKQILSKKFGNTNKIGSLTSSSDGLECSFSSSSNHSCGSTGATVCLHQRRQLPVMPKSGAGVGGSQHYISSDGSVFTLASNTHYQQFNRNNRAPQTPVYIQQRSSGEPVAESSSPHSSSTANLDQLDAPGKKQQSDDQSTRSQQQHRLLQYQVHQQLQHIYGNQEKQSQPFNPNQPFERQKFFLRRHQLQQKQQNSSDNQINLALRSDVMKDFESTNPQHRSPLSNQAMFNQQQRHHHHHQHHVDQTYVSLSPNDNSKEQVIEDFYDVAGILHNKPQVAIGAIPEECDHDNEDDELLIPEARVTVNNSNRVGVIDRKSQIESLHYATVTAAALLSATANAAAAFVATDKQFEPPKPPVTRRMRIATDERPKRVRSNAIYSDTYHYAKRQRPQSEPQHQPTYIERPQQVNHYSQQRNQQNVHRNPIYACANDTFKAVQLESIEPTYNPIGRAQHHHAQSPCIQRFNPIQKKPPLPPNNRVIRSGPMNQTDIQAAQMIRNQQQMQQQRLFQQRFGVPSSVHQPPPLPNQIPALAILHHSGKNRAEIVGKVVLDGNAGVQQRQLAPSYVQAGELMGFKNVQNKHSSQLALVAPKGRFLNQPGQLVPTSMASMSDIGGMHNLPIALRQKIEPLGCIERICRIDLAIFWWSLLLVSLTFIGAVITISRYVF